MKHSHNIQSALSLIQNEDQESFNLMRKNVKLMRVTPVNEGFYILHTGEKKSGTGSKCNGWDDE